MCYRGTLFFLISLLLSSDSKGVRSICSSQIYCNEAIIQAVDKAKIFKDSKTFVDMPLKYSADETLTAFEKINKENASEVVHFVQQYFDNAGLDINLWIPHDWSENPEFLLHVVDDEYHQWAKWLNKLWLSFGRQVDESVAVYPDRHSLLFVPKPFIVPGGRFREFYYWDTFWIIQGLLVCNMTETVENILINFSYLVDRYGMVPNGGRVYYTHRSQPPLLTLMVWEYYQKTHNLSIIFEHLQSLKKEHHFWITNRTVNVTDRMSNRTYQFVHFHADSNTPRPESYREDVETASGLESDEAAALYEQIASAAESGWDFSSRWMSHSGYLANTMQSLKTSHIIPVDLNVILCQVEIILSQMSSLVEDSDVAQYYTSLAMKRAVAIQSTLWNETAGIWQDYDTEEGKQINLFFASALVPLATNCYNPQLTENLTRVQKVIATVKSKGLFSYAAALPTSLVSSGQQWDFPNGWPPLQWFAIIGMLNANDLSTRKVAHDLTSKWIHTNWKTWKKTGHMYEKYDARIDGVPGGGGEYNVQTGFGWTNGVALFLLDRFGNSINHVSDSEDLPGNGVVIGVVVSLLVIIAVFIVSYFGYKVYHKGKLQYHHRIMMTEDTDALFDD